MKKQTKLVRIDAELAKQIADLADKNKLSLTEASRELAKINMKMQNRRVFKEIRI